MKLFVSVSPSSIPGINFWGHIILSCRWHCCILEPQGLPTNPIMKDFLPWRLLNPLMAEVKQICLLVWTCKGAHFYCRPHWKWAAFCAAILCQRRSLGEDCCPQGRKESAGPWAPIFVKVDAKHHDLSSASEISGHTLIRSSLDVPSAQQILSPQSISLLTSREHASHQGLQCLLCNTPPLLAWT